MLYGPSLTAAARAQAVEIESDLPSLGRGATANVDVMVTGA
jgi:hypothetical protein